MPCHTRMKTLFLQGLFWLCLLELGFMVTSLEPGYLDFDNLPDTNFSCVGKVIGGYYADLETSCQMFHVCTIGQLDEPMDIRFLCLNGTVFDQETRVCERIDEVDCSKSEQFYSLNLELYGNTQPPILEDSPETDPPIVIKPPTTTTTTTSTTTTPQSTKPKTTRPSFYTTSRPPTAPTTIIIPPTPKVISTHHFPVGHSADIRFNPAEINISLNPGQAPIIKPKPQSYQQQSFNGNSDKNKRVIVTTLHTTIYKNENKNRVPVLVNQNHEQQTSLESPKLVQHEQINLNTEKIVQQTTLKPKNVFNYHQTSTPTEVNYGFNYDETESDVEYHTKIPHNGYQYENVPSFRVTSSAETESDFEANKNEHVFKSSTYRNIFNPTTKHPHPSTYRASTTYRTQPIVSSSVKPSQQYQYHRSEKPARIQLPLPLLPTLPPLTFSSPAPFTLNRHVETKRFTDHHVPRIVISASASVSDASGRRLNYSLGTIGTSEIFDPSSYEDYKEEEIGLEHFYSDVPKIKNGSARQKRHLTRRDVMKKQNSGSNQNKTTSNKTKGKLGHQDDDKKDARKGKQSNRAKRDTVKPEDIIKSEQEAIDILKFLYEWYENREKMLKTSTSTGVEESSKTIKPIETSISVVTNIDEDTTKISIPVSSQIITDINNELSGKLFNGNSYLESVDFIAGKQLDNTTKEIFEETLKKAKTYTNKSEKLEHDKTNFENESGNKKKASNARNTRRKGGARIKSERLPSNTGTAEYNPRRRGSQRKQPQTSTVINVRTSPPMLETSTASPYNTHKENKQTSSRRRTGHRNNSRHGTSSVKYSVEKQTSIHSEHPDVTTTQNLNQNVHSSTLGGHFITKNIDANPQSAPSFNVTEEGVKLKEQSTQHSIVSSAEDSLQTATENDKFETNPDVFSAQKEGKTIATDHSHKITLTTDERKKNESHNLKMEETTKINLLGYIDDNYEAVTYDQASTQTPENLADITQISSSERTINVNDYVDDNYEPETYRQPTIFKETSERKTDKFDGASLQNDRVKEQDNSTNNHKDAANVEKNKVSNKEKTIDINEYVDDNYEAQTFKDGKIEELNQNDVPKEQDNREETKKTSESNKNHEPETYQGSAPPKDSDKIGYNTTAVDGQARAQDTLSTKRIEITNNTREQTINVNDYVDDNYEQETYRQPTIFKETSELKTDSDKFDGASLQNDQVKKQDNSTNNHKSAVNVEKIEVSDKEKTIDINEYVDDNYEAQTFKDGKIEDLNQNDVPKEQDNREETKKASESNKNHSYYVNDNYESETYRGIAPPKDSDKIGYNTTAANDQARAQDTLSTKRIEVTNNTTEQTINVNDYVDDNYEPEVYKSEITVDSGKNKLSPLVEHNIKEQNNISNNYEDVDRTFVVESISGPKTSDGSTNPNRYLIAIVESTNRKPLEGTTEPTLTTLEEFQITNSVEEKVLINQNESTTDKHITTSTLPTTTIQNKKSESGNVNAPVGNTHRVRGARKENISSSKRTDKIYSSKFRSRTRGRSKYTPPSEHRDLTRSYKKQTTPLLTNSGVTIAHDNLSASSTIEHQENVASTTHRVTPYNTEESTITTHDDLPVFSTIESQENVASTTQRATPHKIEEIMVQVKAPLTPTTFDSFELNVEPIASKNFSEYTGSSEKATTLEKTIAQETTTPAMSTVEDVEKANTERLEETTFLGTTQRNDDSFEQVPREFSVKDDISTTTTLPLTTGQLQAFIENIEQTTKSVLAVRIPSQTTIKIPELITVGKDYITKMDYTTAESTFYSVTQSTSEKTFEAILQADLPRTTFKYLEPTTSTIKIDSTTTEKDLYSTIGGANEFAATGADAPKSNTFKYVEPTHIAEATTAKIDSTFTENILYTTKETEKEVTTNKISETTNLEDVPNTSIFKYSESTYFSEPPVFGRTTSEISSTPTEETTLTTETTPVAETDSTITNPTTENARFIYNPTTIDSINEEKNHSSENDHYTEINHTDSIITNLATENLRFLYNPSTVDYINDENNHSTQNNYYTEINHTLKEEVTDGRAQETTTSAFNAEQKYNTGEIMLEMSHITTTKNEEGYPTETANKAQEKTTKMFKSKQRTTDATHNLAKNNFETVNSYLENAQFLLQSIHQNEGNHHVSNSGNHKFESSTESLLSTVVPEASTEILHTSNTQYSGRAQGRSQDVRRRQGGHRFGLQNSTRKTLPKRRNRTQQNALEQSNLTVQETSTERVQNYKLGSLPQKLEETTPGFINVKGKNVPIATLSQKIVNDTNSHALDRSDVAEIKWDGTQSSAVNEHAEEVAVTDAPFSKSANPTLAKQIIKRVHSTTPISRLIRIELRKEKINKGFIFNCFNKQLNRYYSDPRDCRLFHYCTVGYTKNQLLDMKFVCDFGTYFDDQRFVCTKEKPARCR